MTNRQQSRGSGLLERPRSLAGIDVFVHVARTQSFTETARALGMSASGASRAISRLEASVGARLLQRTTRTVRLTDEGELYRDRCEELLAALRAVESEIAGRSHAASGTLRVDAAMVLAELVFGPAIPRFLALHPEVRLEVTVRDHDVDPVRERIDLMLRIGSPEREDSALVSHRLGALAIVTAASPDYLRRSGVPRSVPDLRRHSCIGFLVSGRPLAWRFADGSEHAPRARVHAASGTLLTRAAIAGAGVVQLYEPFVREALASGALVSVLDDLAPAPAPVLALYPNRKLPSRARAFVTFLRSTLGAERSSG